MIASVAPIWAARKKRNEAGETMHYVAPENLDRNDCCVHCRRCTICGDSACNKPGEDHGHVWTSDISTWANHSNPCKKVPIIGGGQHDD